MEYSVLIGNQIISRDGNVNELLKFKQRFLYNTIQKGSCVVLVNIDEVPSRVIEGLNGLLDKKTLKKKKYLMF